jgi:WD40 repeat protein
MPCRRILLLCLLLVPALGAEAGQGPPATKDLYGDPLPAGAVARLGTLRFRHDAMITLARFLPGGQRVLSVSSDGIACVWEFPSGKPILRFATHASNKPLPSSDDELLFGLPPSLRAAVPTRAVALSPDGKTLATSFSVTTPLAALLNAAPPAKGGKKATPTRTQTDIRLHDVATGKERAAWKVDAAIVPEMAFSPDGKHLSVWGNDGFARIWDWAAGKEVAKVATIGGSTTPSSVGGLAYSPDGKTLLLSRTSRVLQFVEVATGKAVGPPPSNTESLTSIWFTPDGKHVLTQAGSSLASRSLSARTLSALLGQAGSTTRRWEAATGKDLGAIKLPPMPGNPTVISPDGRIGVTVATFPKAADARAAKARPAVLFDTASGKQLGEIELEVEVTPVHRKPLVFSPDGKMLAVNAGSAAGKIDLYAVPSGKRLRTLDAGSAGNPQGPGGFIALGRLSQQMLFSPDGKVLAVRPEDAGSAIVLLDTTTGNRIGSLALTPPNNVLPALLAFTPDGHCLALDMGDGTVALFELATGQPRRTYGTKVPAQPGPGGGFGVRGGGPGGFGGPAGLFGGVLTDPGRSLAFSPDGRTLALAGTDGAILVLDIVTGKELADFKGHTATVNAVAFTSDGKTLASASADTTALLWDITRVKRPAAPAKAPQPGDLDRWWQALAEKDAAVALAALADFAAASDAAVAFLKERVRPAARLDEKQVRALIGRLDDAQYKVREKAVNDLMHLGESILPLVDQALVTNPSSETRKRLEYLRGQMTGRLLHGERLRAYRAVEVLERIGTPEARQVLQALADGAPGALITASAQAALKR